ncbi:MAG: hypothetical protein PHE43_02120 [Candidatus Nanoarchaeia archaeon]|nr:hypothetical protein [Candidatus Nanoarchaeia archaeon]
MNLTVYKYFGFSGVKNIKEYDFIKEMDNNLSKKIKYYFTPKEFDENGRSFKDYSPEEILDYIEGLKDEFFGGLTPEEENEYIQMEKERALGKYGQIPSDLEKNLRNYIAKLKNEKSKSQ